MVRMPGSRPKLSSVLVLIDIELGAPLNISTAKADGDDGDDDDGCEDEVLADDVFDVEADLHRDFFYVVGQIPNNRAYHDEVGPPGRTAADRKPRVPTVPKEPASAPSTGAASSGGGVVCGGPPLPPPANEPAPPVPIELGPVPLPIEGGAPPDSDANDPRFCI